MQSRIKELGEDMKILVALYKKQKLRGPPEATVKRQVVGMVWDIVCPFDLQKNNN